MLFCIDLYNKHSVMIGLCLEQASVLGIFNSHLRPSGSDIPVEVRGIEPEWAVFKNVHC